MAQMDVGRNLGNYACPIPVIRSTATVHTASKMQEANRKDLRVPKIRDHSSGFPRMLRPMLELTAGV